MTICITNETDADVDAATLERLARHVLDRMGVHPLAELSILLVDVDHMAVLHERYMDEPGPTDVLAFPMDELGGSRVDDEDEPEPTLLGDVVLCPQVAAAQAREAGHSTEDELHLLCTHGVLHLLGYDHADEVQEREMFGLQGELLASWADERDQAR